MLRANFGQVCLSQTVWRARRTFDSPKIFSSERIRRLALLPGLPRNHRQLIRRFEEEAMFALSPFSVPDVLNVDYFQQLNGKTDAQMTEVKQLGMGSKLPRSIRNHYGHLYPIARS